MSNPSKRKRSTTGGVKAFIAAASVAATIAGWAILPSNDPTVAATPPETIAASEPQFQPAPAVPVVPTLPSAPLTDPSNGLTLPPTATAIATATPEPQQPQTQVQTPSF